MSKVLDIAFYDLIHHFRSVFAVGMMFIAPLLTTALIYFAFGGGGGSSPSIQPLAVAVTNLDHPAGGKESLAQPLLDIMNDSDLSDLLKTRETPDELSARTAVDQQQAGVAIIVPQDFTRTINRGRNNTQIKIIQDPTLNLGPAVVKNLIGMYLDGINGFRILAQLITDRLQHATHPVSSDDILNAINDYKDWFKENQDKLYHSDDLLLVNPPAAVSPAASAEKDTALSQMMGLVLAGQMLFFAFYTGAYAMMSILHEQEQGTLARLFTTPTERTIILAGKFLAVYGMVLVQSLVMLAAGALLFHIQWGQPLSIALLLIGQVAAASGLGVLLISLVKTSKQAGPVLGGGLTVLGMLGGLFTSNVEMPEAFKRLAYLTPQGWAIQGWKLAINQASFSEVLLPFCVLLFSGLLMAAAGAAIFKRRYA
jgi:ABC-2 type transport system permease protein